MEPFIDSAVRRRSTARMALLLPCILSVTSSQAFDTNTHRAVSLVAVRNHSEARVDSFLKTQLGSPLGLSESVRLFDPGTGTLGPMRSLEEWIASGAMEEDLPALPRVFRHFYNPLRQEGLTDGSTCSLNKTIEAWSSSVDWAWNGRGRLAVEAPVGWQLARQFFFDALTGTDAQTGSDRMANTMELLGRVIHLLQDAAQPQHSRNDAHVPDIYGGESAPFETYCSSNYGAPAQILSLPFVPVPQLPLPPSELIAGIDPRFYAFWNTFQFGRSETVVINPRQLNPDRLGLAEFSCAFFVTDSTLFTGEKAVQLFFEPAAPSGLYEVVSARLTIPWRHRFPYPRIWDVEGWGLSLGLADRIGADAVRFVRYGEGNCDANRSNLVFTAPIQLRHRQLNLNDYCSIQKYGNELWVGLTDVNRRAHAGVLLPKAVAYSTGLLNYFFRGRLSCRLTLSDCSSDTRGVLEISNQSGDDLTGGEIILLEDDGYGTPHRILGSYPMAAVQPVTGELIAGATARVRLYNLVVRGRTSVVYRGTMGTEEDNAVAVGLAPVTRISSDELTFTGGFGARPTFVEPTNMELDQVAGGPYHSGSSVKFRARLTRTSDGQGIPCRDIWFFVQANGRWNRISLGRDAAGNLIFPKTDSDGWAEVSWTLPTVNAPPDEVRSWPYYAEFSNKGPADYFDDSESSQSTFSVQR